MNRESASGAARKSEADVLLVESSGGTHIRVRTQTLFAESGSDVFEEDGFETQRRENEDAFLRSFAKQHRRRAARAGGAALLFTRKRRSLEHWKMTRAIAEAAKLRCCRAPKRVFVRLRSHAQKSQKLPRDELARFAVAATADFVSHFGALLSDDASSEIL